MPGQTKLEATYRRADRVSSKPLDDDTRQQVDERWLQIHTGYDFTDPSEFGRFAQAFLKRRYQRIDADERRDKLCACGSALCNVLNGKLPVRLQPNWGWDSDPVTPQDARRWLNQHQACQGMQDALSAWERGKKQTRKLLREIIALAQGGTVPASTTAPGTAAAQKIDPDNVPGQTTGERDEDDQDTDTEADADGDAGESMTAAEESETTTDTGADASPVDDDGAAAEQQEVES